MFAIIGMPVEHIVIVCRLAINHTNVECLIVASNAAPAPPPKPPVFTQKPAIRQAGRALNIECRLTTESPPTFTWTLNGNVLPNEGRYKMTHVPEANDVHLAALEISNIAIQDGGEYKAVARTAGGEAVATLNLNLEGNIMTP